jgi:two-component system, chemotaxis family, protein-glutamate methylesterase/glutaminase
MHDVRKCIRVVVIDDSPTVCRLLTESVRGADDIQVAAMAHDGVRGVAAVREMRPDVVTLDVDMPGMSGVETLKVIMQECPTPVIMVSGVSGGSANATLEALGAGAIDFILKYTPGASRKPTALRDELIGKIRMAAGIQVVRTVRTGGLIGLSPESSSRPATTTGRGLPFPVIVIGASTGGPVAVRKILAALPAEFPGAIVIVQHLPATFTAVFAEQLNRASAISVREASDGDTLRPGTALVAPGGLHLEVTYDGRVRTSSAPEIEGHRPAIDVTMRSAAAAFGGGVCGVVLTGMGRDGSRGLQAIREVGGRTFAQDGYSCVVNGMPQSAVDLGVVDVVAPPPLIAQRLIRMCCDADKEAE